MIFAKIFKFSIKKCFFFYCNITGIRYNVVVSKVDSQYNLKIKTKKMYARSSYYVLYRILTELTEKENNMLKRGQKDKGYFSYIKDL